jgi:hypothetical protein
MGRRVGAGPEGAVRLRVTAGALVEPAFQGSLEGDLASPDCAGIGSHLLDRHQHLPDGVLESSEGALHVRDLLQQGWGAVAGDWWRVRQYGPGQSRGRQRGLGTGLR